LSISLTLALATASTPIYKLMGSSSCTILIAEADAKRAATTKRLVFIFRY
jgi:hypothetical protein